MIVCTFKELSRYEAVIPGLREAIDAVNAMTEWTPGTIPLSGGNRILVQEGVTNCAQGRTFEAHRAYLDIQYIVEGQETVGWAPLDSLTETEEFDTAKDKGTYVGQADFVRIGAGNCYVVFPEDAHMPGVHLDEPHAYKKLVLKLKV